jgi:hypothetical protein
MDTNIHDVRRIVLLGATLAGKTSVIRALRDLKGANINRIAPDASEPIMDRGVSATWRDGDITFEVSTLSGAVWDSASWRAISPPDAKFVFLMDVQAAFADHSLAELAQAWWLALGPLAAIQVTKTDLIGKAPTVDLQSMISRFERIELPLFMSRHDQPTTQIAACCHVLGCSTKVLR